ncbi:bolA-like protein 3 [Biomphalaria glabrata]|uniref:BolA-like protein 3 n=1 Tax=Biomphalaria glabrata TaxID=6526 RepID=A0A2C9KSP6_BIOGL|nr:bolA-like protein 3 [Biomphalaria glabrata]KAI8763307.1 bolA-like protein 3 [Biomphalaria glabrata]KAI8791085.1 bolA protein 3 [Biomphalaria glabrata]
MQRLFLMLRTQFRCITDINRHAPSLFQQFRGLSSGQESSTTESSSLTPGESAIKCKLQKAFPSATEIQVSDVSGGCGAMYQIAIESPDFKGLPKIQQHRLVNQALAEEIKSMHGLQLTTKAPDQ